MSGNFTGQTQTATLIVEQKYQNFEQGTAYATSFLLAFVSVPAWSSSPSSDRSNK